MRVPKFILKIFQNLKFVAFHAGIKCVVTPLSRKKNRIYVLNMWSKIETAITFLGKMVVDPQKLVIHQQLDSMGQSGVGKTIYRPEEYVRAFGLYASSRSTYESFREYYKLACIRTLQRITAKISNLADDTYLENIFGSLGKKSCVIIQDEIYIKKCSSIMAKPFSERRSTNLQSLQKRSLV